MKRTPSDTSLRDAFSPAVPTSRTRWRGGARFSPPPFLPHLIRTPTFDQRSRSTILVTSSRSVSLQRCSPSVCLADPVRASATARE